MAGADAENRDTMSSNGSAGGDETWGTLEELLLACAVNRHGPNSWDSIAKELEKRTCSRNRNRNNHTTNPGDRFLNAFTPLNCRQKYRDLKCRFSVHNSNTVVDELRKLRVEELKREVQRHDASIVSLQLKVTRLQEDEREKSSESGKTEGAAADLIIQTHGNGTMTGRGTRRKRRKKEDKSPPPDEAADVTVSAAEDRSFNESNSTSHGDENRRATAEEERESHGYGSEEPGRVRAEFDGVEPDKECSVRRKLGDNGRMEGETSGASGASESKRKVKVAARQRSDVQSSASLWRRKRRREWGGGGGSSGDEHTVEEVSPANGRFGVQSEPLSGFLEKLRSHKHGSVFDRRLPSQETDKYRNMIRQHVDLGTVQSKFDRGVYRDSHLTFYRDLLLAFTNAVQFYPKSSAEHIAARELRKLVKQEINQKTRMPKPEIEIQLLDLAVKKPRTANTIEEEEEEKKMWQTGSGASERTPKAQPYRKAIKTGAADHDHGKETGKWVSVPKKLTREKPAALRSIVSDRGNNTNKKNNVGKQEDQSINNSGGGRRREPGGKKESKQEKAGATTGLRKQGVANFLRRMKQNSPSRKEAATMEEADNGREGKEKDRDEEKRTMKKKKESGANRNGKGSGKEEDEVVVVVVRRTSGRRQGIDKDTVGKRKAGMMPMRKTAMDPPPVAPAGRRKREGGGGGGSAGRLKKKSRR